MIVCVVPLAQLELEHMMTLHLRSRKFPSVAAFVETVRVLAALSDRVAGRKSPPPQRPGVSSAADFLAALWADLT